MDGPMLRHRHRAAPPRHGRLGAAREAVGRAAGATEPPLLLPEAGAGRPEAAASVRCHRHRGRPPWLLGFSPGAGGCSSPSRPLSSTPGPEPRPAPRTAPGRSQESGRVMPKVTQLGGGNAKRQPPQVQPGPAHCV
ncbi:synapsin-1-like isoform X2 [Acinonyx jubatus]|uniref:Synapsin-1-like isoform X2 n=1 Tax=Acinonyx jubatus TaxID=32536 RepID=A0ABM3P0P0_ACIJB|nr:synapsin-1-like isoform X2 [Acinonyx jubatus]